MYAPTNNKIWENNEFTIVTPINPHIPYKEGLHLVVAPKIDLANAWEDTVFAGKAFELASRACKLMADQRVAPWFNIQANGNWGLLPGATPFFHIHIYGRNQSVSSWAKPLVLPVAPKTYSNPTMPDRDIELLKNILKDLPR